MKEMINRIRQSRAKHALLFFGTALTTIGQFTDGKPRLVLSTVAGTCFLIWMALGDWD